MLAQNDRYKSSEHGTETSCSAFCQIIFNQIIYYFEL